MDNAERIPSENHNKQRIDAIKRFDNQLTSQDEMLTNFDMKMFVREFAGATLDYNTHDVDGLMEYFEKYEAIPENHKILEDEQAAIEQLRLAVFCEIGDLYAINHSKEDFNEWIEPFLRFVLAGHINESGNHADECNSEKCIAEFIGFVMTNILCDQKPTLDGKEAYIVFADEFINMNISVVKTLEKLKVYDDAQVNIVLEDYEWWMKSLDQPVFYDKNIFKQLRRKNKKVKKPIVNDEK